ncbi:MAG: hypothetical protein NT162_00880, partial [Candidatus Woesebacteria bacterium]|nr:hypothetical protein [Candidatus Woesebacteria bacterium]
LEKISKRFLWVTVAILGYLLIVNVKFFFSENWFNVNSVMMSDDLTHVPFSLQEKVAGFISNDAGSRSFSLARVGPLDSFGDDFSLNYQFLLRNLNKKPDKSALLRYTIYEDTYNLPQNEKIFWVENIAVSKNE